MPLFTNYNIKNFLSAFLSRNVHCNLENMSLPRMFYSNKTWLFLPNISNDANSSHFFLTAGCKSTRLCMCMMERHARVLESLNLILNTWLFLEIRIIRVLLLCRRSCYRNLRSLNSNCFLSLSLIYLILSLNVEVVDYLNKR